MLLPLRSDRRRRRPPVITPALIALTLLSQIAVYALGDPYQNALILDTARPTAWGWVTYAFLHAGLLHIIGNMLFLWVFGPDVEDRLGRVGFTVFYLAGAAVSAWAFATFDQGGRLVGASGAVAGVTGAFLVLFPRVQIRVLLVFILIGVFALQAWWFIAFKVVWDLMGVGFARGSRVAHSAHLGGYAFGAAVAMGLLMTRILPREPSIDLFSLLQHRSRRRQFQAAAGIDAERRRRVAPGADEDRAESKRLRAIPEPEADPKRSAARAAVASAVSAGQYERAADAYLELLRNFGGTPGAATLSKEAQLAVGNTLFNRGDHTSAAKAYERYLDAYPHDPETPRVRLLLGLVLARYLNDPVAAKAQLARAKETVRDADDRELASTLLEELA